MGLRPLEIFMIRRPTVRGQTLYVDPRTVMIKIFLMVIDPYHRYSNESEKANEDIYDAFKFKKTPFGCDVFYKLIQTLDVRF